MDKFSFQYCPKIAVFRHQAVLLCRRAGEADFDGVFSFIGGKMERGDPTIIDALRREKNEEVGVTVRLSVLIRYSVNAEFLKSDGSRMILPHYLANFLSGDIELGEEYSEYRWIEIGKLHDFSPLVPNIPDICRQLLRLRQVASEDDFVRI